MKEALNTTVSVETKKLDEVFLGKIGEELQTIDSGESTSNKYEQELETQIRNLGFDTEATEKYIAEGKQVLKPFKKRIFEASNKFQKATRKYMLVLFMLVMQYPHDQPKPSSDKETAKTEMAKYGITKEQRKRHISGVSEFLYKAVTPFKYNIDKDRVKDVYENLTKGRENREELIEEIKELGENLVQGREDAWRLYLGLNQENNTFGISDYQPAKSLDKKYYFKINNFLENFKKYNQNENKRWGKTVKDKADVIYRDDNPIKQLLRDEANSTIDDESNFSFLKHDTDEANLIMGHYKLSKGQDEKGCYISYYDRWNLEAAIIEGEKGNIGTPFEIYDRIYYDPQTFEVITPENK